MTLDIDHHRLCYGTTRRTSCYPPCGGRLHARHL
eukprot:XP_001709594.1 Hypothetical protein GL50803_38179 [Giardia lamblia ATCC 50803]